MGRKILVKSRFTHRWVIMGNGRSIPLETPYRSPRMSPWKIHVPMSETFRIFAPSNHPRPMPQTAHKTSPPNHPRSQRVGSGILYHDTARFSLCPLHSSATLVLLLVGMLVGCSAPTDNHTVFDISLDPYEGFSFPDKRAVLESIVFYNE